MEQVKPIRTFCWRESLLEELGAAGYALSRFAKPLPGGYVWQEWAYRLLVARRAGRVQGPGSRHLFGYASASGLRHELDAAGIRDVAVVLELKDQADSVARGQVDEFDGKTFDYFAGAALQGYFATLYRMIWSTSEIAPPVRRYAALRGIAMVGPDRVPLPALLAASERWDAECWFPERLLSELVLLGERACAPLAWEVDRCKRGHRYTHPASLWTNKELDDLEYLHDAASEEWLDWLDRTAPFYYERLAAHTLRLVSGWSELESTGSPFVPAMESQNGRNP